MPFVMIDRAVDLPPLKRGIPFNHGRSMLAITDEMERVGVSGLLRKHAHASSRKNSEAVEKRAEIFMRNVYAGIETRNRPAAMTESRKNRYGTAQALYDQQYFGELDHAPAVETLLALHAMPQAAAELVTARRMRGSHVQPALDKLNGLTQTVLDDANIASCQDLAILARVIYRTAVPDPLLFDEAAEDIGVAMRWRDMGGDHFPSYRGKRKYR